MFVPGDASNYQTASAGVSITVRKATPVISWASPGSIIYGTPLGGAQLNATASVAGTFAYTPAPGAVLGAAAQTISVVFTPADPANYNSANASVALTVTPAPLTVQANDAGKAYGQAIPAFTATVTGFVAGDSMASLAGVLTFATSATPASAPGNYPVLPGGVSSPNYTIAFVPGTLTISKASTSTALSTSPNPSTNHQTVQITATVSALAPGAGTPSGSVQFSSNGAVLATAPLVNGVARISVAFKKGTYSLTADFAGDGNFFGSSGSAVQRVK